MTQEKPIRLDVLRAKQRPADVVFTVEFWRLDGPMWWHEGYTVSSAIGPLDPKTLRMVAHGVAQDGWRLWGEGGAGYPPARRKVKARRGRR